MHHCGSPKNSTIRCTDSYSSLQVTMPKHGNYNKLMLSYLVDNTNKFRTTLVHLLVLPIKLFINAWIWILLRLMLSYLHISPQSSRISCYHHGVNTRIEKFKVTFSHWLAFTIQWEASSIYACHTHHMLWCVKNTHNTLVKYKYL